MPSQRDWGSQALPALPASLDPRGKHRGSRRRRQWHTALVSLAVVASLLSAGVVGLSGYAWWRYRTFNNNIQRLDIPGLNGGLAAGQPAHDIDGKAQNLLIVGNDDRADATTAELKALGTTKDGGSLNTDTMMIIHIPANGTAATLISLPRDSYVNIPGFGMDKINAAYSDAYYASKGSLDSRRAAGAKLAIQTVENLTGLTINHFVQVDLLGFYRISNAIGGVTVNMCEAVKEANSGIDLHKGLNTIKGIQAMAFVRQRYGFPNGLGDLDRVERERYFLTAAFRKLTTAGVLLNPFKLQSLLDAVQSSLYMDSGLNPLTLAQQLQNLSANNIVGKTIPTDGFGTTSSGESVVVVKPAQVQLWVNNLVGTAAEQYAAAKAVPASTVTVAVLNGGSQNGAATKSALVLKGAGFVIGTVADAPSNPTTTVQYPDGMASQAKTLARYVPGATVTQTSSVTKLTLLLGTDGLSAKIPSTTAPRPPATKPPDAGCIQ